MREIFFKFEIGDKVITKFGETGFIDNGEKHGLSGQKHATGREKSRRTLGQGN